MYDKSRGVTCEGLKKDEKNKRSKPIEKFLNAGLIKKIRGKRLTEKSRKSDKKKNKKTQKENSECVHKVCRVIECTQFYSKILADVRG